MTLAPLLTTAVPGPRSLELLARLTAVECPAFEERRRGRPGAEGKPALSIVLARGEGANLWDVDDNRYVDLAAGFGAAILGHRASPTNEAAKHQLDRLVQGLGDLYATEVKVALLERLAALHPSPGARVMLGQSGADAVTAALKTCVLATGRPGVLAFEGSYHGMSYAPLAASGLAAGFRAPFAEQLSPHVRFVPYPRSPDDEARSLEAARAELASDAIGAVLIEPVLGRGGVVVPTDAFLRELAAAARARGALFVADEIWTGLGRSGAMSKSVAAGVVPDVVCVGKALGAGFPISACIATDEAMSGWARGGETIHTSTHAGAPLGCAAALATLDAIEVEALPTRALEVGATFTAALRSALGERATVRSVGLIVGVDLGAPGRGHAATQRLLERGYVATSGGRAGEVVVFTPSLRIEEAALHGVVSTLAELVSEAAP